MIARSRSRVRSGWVILVLLMSILTPQFSPAGAELFSASDMPDPQTAATREPTRRGAITRSVIFPGLGQLYRAQHTRGLLYVSAALGGLALAIAADGRSGRAREDYQVARQQYDQAVNATTVTYWFGELQTSHTTYEHANRQRTVCLAAVAAAWVVSVIDAASGYDVSANGTAMLRLRESEPGEVRFGIGCGP